MKGNKLLLSTQFISSDVNSINYIQFCFSQSKVIIIRACIVMWLIIIVQAFEFPGLSFMPVPTKLISQGGSLWSS